MTIELSEYVINAIADAVVKKMQEPKTGHWTDVYVDDRNEWIMFFCENCGHQFGFEDRECGWRCGKPIPWKYCPNCGCRMIEPQEGSE